MCTQKNRLSETVLLSTHNICVGLEIKKIVLQYALLSGGIVVVTSLFTVAPIVVVLCMFIVLLCCLLCVLGLQSSWLTSSVTSGVTHSIPTAFMMTAVGTKWVTPGITGDRELIVLL